MAVKPTIKPMTDQFKLSQTLDTSGSRCPIPLLKAKQALKTMQVGQFLEVLSTDPAAKGDFDAMLKHLPHELVGYSSTEDSPQVHCFVIRKGE